MANLRIGEFGDRFRNKLVSPIAELLPSHEFGER